MLKCIYCQSNSFENDEGSKEHVILSSIGGKKGSKNICCENCNNELGEKIDKPLSEELRFFSTMLGIRTDGINKKAPTIKNAFKFDEKKIDIKPGGEFVLSGLQKSTHESMDGKTKTIKLAGDEKQVIKVLKGILKGYGKTIDDFNTIFAKKISAYPPEINHRIKLGNELHMRSIAKMMLTYAATLISPKRLRSGIFKDIISYIEGGEILESISYDTSTIFPEKPFISDVNHRIFFITSKKLNLAIGLLELFGNIRFSATLSKNWDGASICKGYAIDPISGQKEDTDLSISKEIFSTVNISNYNNDLIVKSFSRLAEFVYNKQRTDSMFSIIKNTAETNSENETINLDEVVNELVSLVLREDKVKDIDLKNNL